MTHMLHMPSPISTDSEYETQSSGGSPDARSKPVQNDRVADRRRRNGESAKRSRQKRKAALGDMEENYVRLQEGNTHLQEENLRLRQLIASLGADASGIAAHIEPIPSIPEELLSTAKKVKREYRVTTTATSFESAAGANATTGRGDHCTTLDMLSNGEHSLESNGSSANDIDNTANFDITDDIEMLLAESLTTGSAKDIVDILAPSTCELTEMDLAGFVFD
eukprot:TRINITY_DN1005_c0_g1_i1.p1 TRINITY_DN1005_c0_g1~~TRINITY_DN1005_c0_g1_i1.p1  ORF type:complete len:222 (+),score=30.41 TRINITY_DN1005_c0_g1_i1:228-893(+)